MIGQFSVDPAGRLTLVRLRGWVTEALLEECLHRVLEATKANPSRLLLYDAREMYTPPFHVLLFQRNLDSELMGADVCRAIVVSRPRLAYLLRLAYGDCNYRVFYDRIGAATKWLEDPLRDRRAQASAREPWLPSGLEDRRVRSRRLAGARAGTGRRTSDLHA